MSVTDELLANNATYAESFEGPLPLLGTEEIILIHHTDCGMPTFTDDEFKRSIQVEDIAA